jgi:hypothetical protein
VTGASGTSVWVQVDVCGGSIDLEFKIGRFSHPRGSRSRDLAHMSGFLLLLLEEGEILGH